MEATLSGIESLAHRIASLLRAVAADLCGPCHTERRVSQLYPSGFSSFLCIWETVFPARNWPLTFSILTDSEKNQAHIVLWKPEHRQTHTKSCMSRLLSLGKSAQWRTFPSFKPDQPFSPHEYNRTWSKISFMVSRKGRSLLIPQWGIFSLADSDLTFCHWHHIHDWKPYWNFISSLSKLIKVTPYVRHRQAHPPAPSSVAFSIPFPPSCWCCTALLRARLCAVW